MDVHRAGCLGPVPTTAVSCVSFSWSGPRADKSDPFNVRGATACRAPGVVNLQRELDFVGTYADNSGS